MTRAWWASVQSLPHTQAAALMLGDRGLEGLFIALGVRLSTSFSHSSTEQVGSSQETEAQTGRVAGPKVTKNKNHRSARTGHQLLCGPQLSQGNKGQDVCDYSCLATEETGEKNFKFHHLIPSTKEMEKLRPKGKGWPRSRTMGLGLQQGITEHREGNT